MAETQYGAHKALYGVTQAGDTIELRVHTENAEVRGVLTRHASEPNKLLERGATYFGSSIAAQSWLARVMADYRSHFANGRVKIVTR